MNAAYLIQHDDLFGPGRLLRVFRDFGIPCEVVRLHKGEKMPDLDEGRMIVLLGGSMRSTDLLAHPYLQSSIDAARRFVESDLPAIGIGLGGELLSIAGGAKVSELRKPTPPAQPDQPPPPPGEATPEFGWTNVSFPFPGNTEPIVFGMMDGAPFFNWHRDTFALPALPPPPNPPPPPARPPTGNVLMASTRLCRNAAYKFKNKIFGFQFHFELTQDQILNIINQRSADAGLSAEAKAAALEQTHTLYPRHQRLGDKLLENLVQFMKTY